MVSIEMRIIAAGMIVLLGLCTNADSQAIADNMTCAQAVSHYERNGRIYKIAHGKDVIPIYLGVPVSRRNALRCDYGQIIAPYSLRTTDNRRCVIAYQCVAGGWDR
jgi:hypothetical protein